MQALLLQEIFPQQFTGTFGFQTQSYPSGWTHRRITPQRCYTTWRVPSVPCTTIAYHIPTGYVQVIEGEGMPVFGQSGHGNLYIEYNVVLPVDLGSDMRKSEILVRVTLANSPFTCLQNLEKLFMGQHTMVEMSCRLVHVAYVMIL